MAPLSNHVSLSISVDTVGVARAGFGIPMLISYNASGFGAERLRTYSSLAEVVADFASTTGPEYLWAQAAFSQSPGPETVAIGRGALPPTQKFTLTPVVQNSHVYSLRVGGDGVTETTVTYTSDGSATAAEIVAALTTSINAISNGNFTASGSSTLILTADAAGEWFFVEADEDDWALVQDHADPGIATDLAAIQVADDTWYALDTVYNSNAMVLAAAAWIEAQKKIYLPTVNDTGSITAAAGNSDTIDDLATLGYERVGGCYHPALDEMLSAAWLGARLNYEPGSATFKFARLSGISTVVLTSTQRSNLRGKNGNSVETVSGIKFCYEGTTSDGGFLDNKIGLDWLEDDMSAGIFGALAGSPKIPYTDAGVSIIKAEVLASLKRAVDRGILADDPSPVVTVPKVADVSSGNKTARTLPDVKFSATLAGAIHKVIVTGVVSI